MTEAVEGTLLWEPSEEFKANANVTRYMEWLKDNKNLSFDNYEDLWEWSVTNLEAFWKSIWGVRRRTGFTTVPRGTGRPPDAGSRVVPRSRVKLRRAFFSATRGQRRRRFSTSRSCGRSATVSWKELRERVAATAAALRSMGVERGDRVVAYIPNIPEALIAFLATASIGAVWSSCSPDFGAKSVIDRFAQIEPKALFAVDGYRYGGKDFDRTDTLAQLQEAMPSLQKTVVVPYLNAEPDTSNLRDVTFWEAALAEHEGAELTFEQVPFDHPLWVLYSSGTTGLPKAIVQGHGGILLEHLKKLTLHMNAGEDDRFFWFTTTGWMMWNVVVSGLLSGASILMYDGNPGYPDMNVLWEFAEQTGMTCFGTSASYLTACRDAGISPGRDFDLGNLRSVGSTGSPLPPEGFAWVYEDVKSDVWLFSTSGGTDLCTAFVGGMPILPVRTGELQCRSLGASVQAFDEEGLPARGRGRGAGYNRADAFHAAVPLG